MAKAAWTNTLKDIQTGQTNLFDAERSLTVAVLQLSGTVKVVQAARSTQWSAYGLSVIIDELGGNVGTCTPKTMDNWDVVLYSITSPVDQISMAAELPDNSQRKRSRLIVGGQGAYPIWALSTMTDRVCFGRAEKAANAICIEREPLPFCYDAAGDPKIVKRYQIRASSGLYSQEGSLGCKQACTFCQYTYTRETVGQSDTSAYNAGSQGHKVDEDTIATVDLTKPGRITTALDGWSEATRRKVRKGVTDSFFARRLRTATESINGTIVLKVFQIVGYPWETVDSLNADIEHMREVLASADLATKQNGRVVIMFVNTPFSPEPLTPMQDERAAVDINWRHALIGQTSRCRNVYTGTNIEAFILPQISGPLSLLRRVAVNRGATREQLIEFGRAKTIQDAQQIMPGIWEHGAGKRVTEYLVNGFTLPAYKQKLLSVIR
jgi:hypothetical protein